MNHIKFYALNHENKVKVYNVSLLHFSLKTLRKQIQHKKHNICMAEQKSTRFLWPSLWSFLSRKKYASINLIHFSGRISLLNDPYFSHSLQNYNLWLQKIVVSIHLHNLFIIVILLSFQTTNPHSLCSLKTTSDAIPTINNIKERKYPQTLSVRTCLLLVKLSEDG